MAVNLRRWGALVGILKRFELREKYLISLREQQKTKAQDGRPWAQQKRI